jgi:hypothetical protein
MKKPQTSRSALMVVLCVVSTFVAVCEDLPLLGESGSQTNQQLSSSGHKLVVLLDTNPHQKKVLTVELALAEGIIQKLDQPGNAFSVITFGSKMPTLLKPGATADEAIAALQGATLEQTKEKYFTVRFYDALNLAMNQLTDNARSKSLLVISEGNDYFPSKTFKETVARAQQLQIHCDVAMVSDHTFYGTKGIQRYGFDLRRLAGKTHGQYIEVGGKQKRVPRSVERLSEGILSRGPKSTSASLSPAVERR